MSTIALTTPAKTTRRGLPRQLSPAAYQHSLGCANTLYFSTTILESPENPATPPDVPPDSRWARQTILKYAACTAKFDRISRFLILCQHHSLPEPPIPGLRPSATPPMIAQTLTIARNAFVESIRQPIVPILILVSGITQILNTAMTGFSMGMTESSEVTSDNKLLFDIGISAVFGFGIVLAAFIATSVLSREIENKTVLTVVSKPVGRPTLLIGKYLGVAGAILVSVVIMLLFLLLAIRHGVLSTTSDLVDYPVIVFGMGAVVISIALAAWCNYFYNWQFSQTLTLLLLPLVIIAYLLCLKIGKEWKFQDLHTDFKPQISIACICLTMALLVFASIATAISTRLSQVMTIVVCVGIFVASLMSNYFLGSKAFNNQIAGKIRSAQSTDPRIQVPFSKEDDEVVVELSGPPAIEFKPGMPFMYSSSPSGFPMSTPTFEAFAGDVKTPDALLQSRTPALIITKFDDQKLTVRRLGGDAPIMYAPILPGDYIFVTPTSINAPALTAWGVIPNLQHFWLLDAITQNQPIPAGYVVRATLYAAAQITAFLAIGIVLFMKRDVG